MNLLYLLAVAFAFTMCTNKNGHTQLNEERFSEQERCKEHHTEYARSPMSEYNTMILDFIKNRKKSDLGRLGTLGEFIKEQNFALLDGDKITLYVCDVELNLYQVYYNKEYISDLLDTNKKSVGSVNHEYREQYYNAELMYVSLSCEILNGCNCGKTMRLEHLKDDWYLVRYDE